MGLLAASFFPLLMIYAAVSDFLTMRIANRVSLALALAFVPVAHLAGLGLDAIALNLAIGLACLIVTFGFFAAGWIGGGDAKLFAATSIWFGGGSLLADYVLAAAVIGGGLTLAIVSARALVAPATGLIFLDRLLTKTTGVPYGIALGLAGLLVYSRSFWVDALI